MGLRYQNIRSARRDSWSVSSSFRHSTPSMRARADRGEADRSADKRDLSWHDMRALGPAADRQLPPPGRHTMAHQPAISFGEARATSCGEPVGDHPSRAASESCRRRVSLPRGVGRLGDRRPGVARNDRRADKPPLQRFLSHPQAVA